MLLGHPWLSGLQLTPISHHVISLYLVDGFQWNLAQIFITWMAVAGKVFKIKGHGHGRTKCIFATEAYIPTVSLQDWLVSISFQVIIVAVSSLVSVEQSSCCSMETRDNSAHFHETTEGLSVPHLMWNRRNIHHRPALLWRIRDSGTGYKTADLLTYLLL